jgi:hypothetical protein
MLLVTRLQDKNTELSKEASNLKKELKDISFENAQKLVELK